MLANEILKEYRQADLYHGTSINRAENIIMTNTIQANRTADMRNLPKRVWKDDEDFPRTVSFSRSMNVASRFAQMKSNAYADDIIQGVVLVFDQEKMYHDFGKRLQSYNDLSYMSKKTGFEAEEALVGDLTNVKKYLKEIVVFVKDDYDLESLKQTHKIIMLDKRTRVVVAQAKRPSTRPGDREFYSAREIKHRRERN